MLEKIVLNNGLKIYLINDNSKHTTYINLIVKFGGIDNEVVVNGKKHKLKSGLAHFLEHLVLESSEYGDLMKIFGMNGVGSNGFTTIDRTQFYIDCVDNIENNLGLFLSGIHCPIINEKVIEKIKGPILEEKRRSLDNKETSTIYNASLESIIDAKTFKSILGDLKDIESIGKDDLDLAYDSFYRPDNEILVIGGRFNKESILSVINEVYSDGELSSDKIEKVIPPHKLEVNKKKIIVKEDINLEKSIISFKINTLDMKPFDKVMLDTYLYYFLKNNFGIASELNSRLGINNIIVGNINYSCNLVEGYHVIRIESYTKNIKLFNDIIIDYFINKKFVFDEDFYNLCKRNYIIDLITRSDDLYRTIDPLIENIVTFNYEGIDTIDDIEKMNFEEYKNIIMNLDFSNYSIAILKRK